MRAKIRRSHTDAATRVHSLVYVVLEYISAVRVTSDGTVYDVKLEPYLAQMRMGSACAASMLLGMRTSSSPSGSDSPFSRGGRGDELVLDTGLAA